MTGNTLPRRVHFVGVGGVGMSALAWVLVRRGHEVSGSDQAQTPITANLEANGVKVFMGHAAENLGNAEVCVVSTAIRESNPEFAAAQQRGIPIWHRAQVLASIIDSTEGIAIAGTHGKTTTTGMAAVALDGAGYDPTVLVGGVLPEYGGTAKVGKGPWTVAEADESDGSLTRMHPRWAIVTNIDLDHMDHYRDENHLVETFHQFLEQIRTPGGAVVLHDDTRLTALRGRNPCQIWTYSDHSEEADYRAVDIAGTVDGTKFGVVTRDGERLCDVTLHVPGRHNALNATAVVALCHRLGCDMNKIAKALATFPGVSRRFQRKGSVNGIDVVDDYAHHPTELRVTIDAAKAVHRKGRLVTIFQPHRYSRTQHLWQEFAEVLTKGPDVLVLMDIYSAGETPIEGVSGHMIFDALGENPAQERAFCPQIDDAVGHLRKIAKPGDLVMTLGAGNVVRVGETLLDVLQSEESEK